MNVRMELARTLDPTGEESPLGAARIQRQLTVEEAARRAGLSADEVTWLEEGRVYRFPSTDRALLAALLYGTALGIDHREARALAGLPVPPGIPEANRFGRVVVAAAAAAALTALVFLLVHPSLGTHSAGAQSKQAPPAVALPPPWKIAVDVLNGNGDINWTRQVASEVGALGYRIRHVGRADRFTYQSTVVFYEPGGAKLAARLARTLGVATRPLPGGFDARRLVLIVGPHRGP
jgi:transcriptional regulator with XRE-family HTH domain